ncbi:dihydroorotase [Enterovirga sp. CN4-39]|uniref:dihydroorotase n=1 Tax=Enterovirga sp. CN4-39 TaxID=3400910 RepID=UPI003BFB19C9
MSDFDLLVAGGRVLLASGELAAADLGITQGRIAALLAPGSSAKAAERLDATGLVVLPGIIDAHLHLGHGSDISRPRVPADAAGETAAAAVGGVTTLIPYLMGTTAYEGGLFDEVVQVTEAGARVDFGYHFIIATEEQLAGIPLYVGEYGVSSFKIFMNNRGGEGTRLGLPDIDDGFLYRLAEAAAAQGALVCPHPENIEVSWVLRDREKARDPEGRGGLAAWNATRPPFIEADAVQRAALLSEAAGAALYVVHTSSAHALKAGLAARQQGGRVLIETCPHYLTHDVTWPGGDLGKINPPLRGPADREALWAAVADGSVDTVATDHVHRTAEGKKGGIWAASPGCPGLETLLPVMLTEGHHKRGIPLARISDLLSRNPARIMGLENKGAIEIGKDADLAIVDLAAEWTLGPSDIRSSAGYSIYEGWRFRGQVRHTLVRGAFALRDGALQDGQVGQGRFVHRRAAH